MDKINDKFWVIMFRRAMIKLSCLLAKELNAKALITGENIGQVSSQTLSNIQAIAESSNYPIIRPLAGHNKEEIINTHLKSTLFIYMIGFVPGHPFMGDLDSKLFLNRLKTPRVKVPAGSVGIVEKFCNIYPYESPGGWNIIGRTPIKLFNNKDNFKPSLLSPGDTVNFKKISKKEFHNFENEK